MSRVTCRVSRVTSFRPPAVCGARDRREAVLQGGRCGGGEGGGGGRAGRAGHGEPRPDQLVAHRAALPQLSAAADGVGGRPGDGGTSGVGRRLVTGPAATPRQHHQHRHRPGQSAAAHRGRV